MLRRSPALLRAGRPYQAEMSDAAPGRQQFLGARLMYAINAGREQQDTIWILDDRSAQKAPEEATKKILLEQKAILDNASVGIVFSKAGVMMSCNPRFAEMFGYTQEEMTGRRAVEVFPSPEVYQQFGREAGPLLGNGLPFEKPEFQFRRRDGALFWCRVRAKAVEPDRSEEGTIWILEDVTEARQTLIEVQAIMTNASISILFTKNRLITRYNRGFAEMFGYDGDGGLGLPGRALYPSDEAYAARRRRGGPLLSVGKPFQTEVEMARKDGTRMWAQLIGYVVNPDDPSPGHDLDHRGPHRAEARRRIAAQRAAGKPGHPRQRGAGHRGGGERLQPALQPQDGRAVRLCAGRDRRPVGAVRCTRTRAGWEQARTETARDFRAGRVSMAEYQLVRKDGSRFWARLSGRPFDLDDADAGARSGWSTTSPRGARRPKRSAARATNSRCACWNAPPNWPAPTRCCRARSSSAARPRRACTTWPTTTA